MTLKYKPAIKGAGVTVNFPYHEVFEAGSKEITRYPAWLPNPIGNHKWYAEKLKEELQEFKRTYTLGQVS